MWAAEYTVEAPRQLAAERAFSTHSVMKRENCAALMRIPRSVGRRAVRIPTVQ
jgi:hypothetical protein